MSMMSNNNPDVSAGKILEIVRRRMFLIIAPAILAALAVGIYAYRLPTRYLASATVAADQQQSSSDGFGKPFSIQEQLWAVRVGLFDPSVFDETMKEFRLLPPGESVSSKTMDDLKDRVKIQVREWSTTAFSLSFEAEGRQQTTDIVNRLAERFVTKTTAATNETVEQTASVLDSEAAELKQKLNNQNEAIKRYKERVSDELPESVSTNVRALETLRDQIRSATISIADNQARRASKVREIEELEKKGVLEISRALPPPVVIPKQKSVAQVRLEELSIRLPDIRARYSMEIPQRATAEKEFIALQEIVAREVANEPPPAPTAPPGALADLPGATMRYLQLNADIEEIDNRIRSDRQTISSLSPEVAVYERRISSAPQRERDLAGLLQEYHATENQYQALLTKQNEAGLSQRLGKVSQGLAFRIAEPARLPVAPSSPRRALLILMGLGAGLALGGVLAFGAEHWSTAFRDAGDFQEFATLPVLVEIPSIPGARRPKGSGKSKQLVTISNPNSVAAEQYSILSMKLRNASRPDDATVVVVTSSVGGEGKTLTAVNLSVALAGTMRGQVLLIDADLRQPRVSEYLGIDAVPRGGFGHLLQSADPDHDSFIWNGNGLSVIPAAKGIANPVSLLASPKTQLVMARLRKQFKFIVIDAPPIMPIADGHILAGIADRTMVVIRARRTPRELFKRAVEHFEASNVFGVILNDVDFDHSRYAVAYQYYQKHYRAS